MSAAALGALTLGVLTTTGGSANAAWEDATMELPRSTSQYEGFGPHRPYVQEINIGGVVPLKNQALLNRTPYGWLFRGGQQNNDLTITQVDNRLKFVDVATESWKWLPKACTEIDVPQGVGATCGIPKKFTMAEPMLIEVWPRLGHDTVNTTALSALFDLAFLGDRGDDKAFAGDGDDFINGAQDNDVAEGGAGNDWLRTNIGDDRIDGGADSDYLVGVDGHDVIFGGGGDDFLYGIDGNDKLDGGAGADRLSCGGGKDDAVHDAYDKVKDCETTARS